MKYLGQCRSRGQQFAWVASALETKTATTAHWPILNVSQRKSYQSWWPNRQPLTQPLKLALNFDRIFKTQTPQY